MVNYVLNQLVDSKSVGRPLSNHKVKKTLSLSQCITWPLSRILVCPFLSQKLMIRFISLNYSLFQSLFLGGCLFLSQKLIPRFIRE